jgi:hypothetical protein
MTLRSGATGKQYQIPPGSTAPGTSRIKEKSPRKSRGCTQKNGLSRPKKEVRPLRDGSHI